MITIEHLLAREILDSRGNPTIEVDCLLSDGSHGRASVPSGASTGKHEALELRDGDPKRYKGKGVLKAVANVNTLLRKKLKGKDGKDQQALDEAMIALDGTADKSRLGANAILGVSMAVLKAAAVSSTLPLYAYIRRLYRPKERGPYTLPVPMMNILNGGAHADNSSDFQEFMVMPVGAHTFRQALQMGAEIFHTLKAVLKAKKMNTNVGDEGGFAPTLPSNEAAPQTIVEAIRKAGYRPGKDVLLAMDAAASQFYRHGKYQLTKDRKTLTSEELVAYYQRWVRRFPLCSLEDGLSEEDWDSWRMLMKRLCRKIQIVGDDLFVTNVAIEKKGIGDLKDPSDDVANAILIKLNQIGTVTETVRSVDLAHAAGWRAIISHRSGETEDTTIADVAVGLGTGEIKTGSLSRSERVAKYNRLLRIEEELGNHAVYAAFHHCA